MKLKIVLILATLGILAGMWYTSPLYEYKNRPTLTVITPKQSSLYNSIIVKGYVEESEKKSLRLQHSARIEQVNFSLGDKVKKGDVIFRISTADDAVNVQSVANFFPKIDDLNNIKEFYIPKTITPVADTSPQITAPCDGIITELHVKEGDLAIGQIPIATVSDFNKLMIRASVSELYINEVKSGQDAEITGDAFSGKQYKAKVFEISPIAKKKISLTGSGETTVDVLLKITSENTDLKPGYTVNAKILTDTHPSALSVPYNCIIQEGETEYVYVLKDGKIHKRAIKTGFELESSVEVERGISPNDKIVLNPTYELYDKMEVNAKEDKNAF